MTIRPSFNNHYIAYPGDFVDNFEDISGYTLTGGGNKAADTVNFKQGTQGLKITTASGVECSATKYENVKMSAVSGYTQSLWIYCYTDPSVTLTEVRLYLVNTSGSNYAMTYLHGSNHTLVAGWNEIRLCNTTGTSHNWELNGSFVFTDVQRIKITIVPKAGQQAILTIDDWRHNIKRIPQIVVTFDDGNTSDYTYAFSYMQPLGIKGTSYVSKSLVGDTAHGYATLAQLTTMYESGLWAIGNHTTDHVNLISGGLTEEQVAYEIGDNRDYLNACGFTRSANFLAYPQGDWNDTTVAIAKQQGVLAARAGANTIPMFPFFDSNIWALNCINAATAGVSGITTAINNAITYGNTICIYFHGIVVGGGTPGIDVTPADFQAIMNYIKQSGIKSLTIDEAYYRLTNPRYSSARAA